MPAPVYPANHDTGAISAARIADRRRYADPAHRYVAAYASPWRRAGAAAVDWGLCCVIYLIVSIPLGVVEGLGAISSEDDDLAGIPGRVAVVATQILAFVPVVAYFALLLPTSQTFGMRLLDIRIVSVRTGRGLSRAISVARAVCTTVLALGVYVVFLRQTSFEKNDLDRTSTLLLQAAYVLAALAVSSAIVMLVTPARRTLFDRLFGTAVLDDLDPVVPVVGPWGALNVFDTSHESRPRSTRTQRDRRLESG